MDSPDQTYVAGLPENAVSNVLRFFSARPRAADWPHHFTIDILREFATDHHALNSLAEQTLTDLHLHPSLGGSSETDALEAIFTAFGPICTSLHFNLSPSNPHGWTTAFRSNCTTLKCLDFRSVPSALHLDEILSPLESLEELRLHMLANQHATWTILAEHGVGLRRLHVDVGRQNSPSMRTAFATIGRTLESLSLCMMGSPETGQPLEDLSVGDIGRLCPHIAELDVSGDFEFARTDIQMLCIAYGSQMRRLSVPFAGKNKLFLRSLVHSCPNVRVDTDMKPFNVPLHQFLNGPKPNPTFTMDTLGPLLGGLTVRYGFPITPEFQIAASKCHSLTKFELTECTLPTFGELLRAFFYLPKTELKMLDVVFKQNASLAAGGHMFPEIITSIARNCANLQALGLTIPVLPLAVLERLAEANGRLEYATIRVCFIDAPHPDADEDARVRFFVQVVRAMAKCPSLRSLVITDDVEAGGKLADVENACVCMRFRRASVSVRGVVYLQ